MIGTFTAEGNVIVSDELTRWPFIDISNAPDDETEQRMYDTFQFIMYGRKRHIPPID